MDIFGKRIDTSTLIDICKLLQILVVILVDKPYNENIRLSTNQI